MPIRLCAQQTMTSSGLRVAGYTVTGSQRDHKLQIELLTSALHPLVNLLHSLEYTRAHAIAGLSLQLAGLLEGYKGGRDEDPIVDAALAAVGDGYRLMRRTRKDIATHRGTTATEAGRDLEGDYAYFDFEWESVVPSAFADFVGTD